MATNLPESVEAYAAQRFAQRIERAAAELRGYADDIARQAADVDRVGSPGLPNYATIAARVQHIFENAIPNLGLHALGNDAYDADAARIKGE